LAIAAAAVAAYGAVKAFEQMVEVSDKIGTTSKDDFEEFQKSLEAVGVTLTKTDQVIAQQLNKSFADLKATTDSLFLILLKTTGPALVVLIKEISSLLIGFGPALDIIGRFISANLIQAAAVLEVIGRFIKALKEDASGAFFNFDFVKEFLGALDRVRAATTAVSQSPLIPFEPGKVRAAAKEVDEFAKALADAQKELDKLRAKTGDIIIQNMEDQLKELNQAVADTFDIKKIAAFKFEMVDFGKLMDEQIRGIVADSARQPGGIPGGFTEALGLPDPDEVQGKLDDIQKHFDSFFGQLEASLLNSSDIFSSFTDLAIKGLQGLIGALQTTFQTFILTGQLGAQAFRTLTAALLSQLVIEAVHQVFKMHAKAAEEAAAALADAAAGDYVGATLHAGASAAYAHAAIAWGIVGGGAAVAGIAIGATGGLGGGAKSAAAGGEFGGPTQAPGTVTINQGGGATLGVLLSIDNHLSNITTAPPGDILQRGADQNPMAVGQANNEAARRDGTVSREFLQISGLRTA
jgi:hypothetical protein